MSGPFTILVVDDYPDTLDVWDLYLQSEGFHVLTASSGPAALTTALAERPDLVVMDLELPGLSGLDVAQRLRAEPGTRHIPLIAATGYSHAAQLDRARSAGFDVVIIKPCDPEALVQQIRRLLANGRERAASAGA